MRSEQSAVFSPTARSADVTGQSVCPIVRPPYSIPRLVHGFRFSPSDACRIMSDSTSLSTTRWSTNRRTLSGRSRPPIHKRQISCKPRATADSEKLDVSHLVYTLLARRFLIQGQHFYLGLFAYCLIFRPFSGIGMSFPRSWTKGVEGTWTWECVT